jgi:pimeloyl-ACP methyl ester carboxylesterase
MQIRHKGIDFDIASDSREGSRSTIVFLHGLLCSKDHFKDAMKYFQNCRLIAVDIPGFGKSSKPYNFSYSMEDQSEILNAVLEKTVTGKFHLVGHSMGGVIGLIMANKYPYKIRSFCNIEGNLIGQDCSLSRKIIEMSKNEFLKKKFEGSTPEAVYRSSKSLVEWADSRKLIDMFLNLKKKTYFSCDRNVLPCTNLIKGKSEIVTVKNSGHLIMKDNPEELYQKIEAVL